MAIEYFEDGLYVSLSNITEEDIEELAEMAGEVAEEDPEFAEEIEHMCDEIDVLCAAESLGIDASELAHYGTSAGARLRWERLGRNGKTTGTKWVRKAFGNGVERETNRNGRYSYTSAGGHRDRKDHNNTYLSRSMSRGVSRGVTNATNARNSRININGRRTSGAQNMADRSRTAALNAARNSKATVNYADKNAGNRKNRIFGRVGGAFRKLRSGKSTNGSRRAAAVRLASRIRGAFRGK